MKVYITLLICVVISLYLHAITNNKVFKCLPYYFLAFVSGFRNEVGADYISYRDWFYDILLKRGWYKNTEIGFRTFVQTIDFFRGTPQVMFLIMACLTCYFYYKFISENSRNFELSTMLFMCLGPFYFSSYNSVREAFAISVFLFALKYYDKDVKKYICLLLIAGIFHTSALPFLLFPLTRYLKHNYLTYTIILSVVGDFSIRSKLLDFVLAKFAPVYSRYSNMSAEMDITYILYFIISLMVFLLLRQLKWKVKPQLMYMMVFSCTLIFIAMSTGRYAMFLTRFISWGTPALIVILPEVGLHIKPKWIYNAMIYSFCIAYFLRITSTGTALLPYAFNFNLIQ